MVKALSFKGDPKPKKRKRTDPAPSTSTALTDPTPASTSTAEDDDETWVSASSPTDLSGPVLLILPTTTPATCLATDANGVIYASQLENLIDGRPETAEPHDVRQVWVANRVAGTEEVSFKGYHGRYLGSSRYGGLEAVAEARGGGEGWIVTHSGTEGEGFKLRRAVGGTYIRASVKETREEEEEGKRKRVEVEIRADVEEEGEASKVVVRMQARFKPRLMVEKKEKAREKISRSVLEAEVGRKLEDGEVKKLKKARRDGTYYEAMLDVKVKGKHDKYA